MCAGYGAGEYMKSTLNYHHYWPELFRGILIKRYKRFLADIELESGEIITAHCANSGAMKSSSEPGRPVYVSFHDNPKRKLKFTWEMIEMENSLVGVNTNVPNKLVKTAIENKAIPELSAYQTIKPEVKTSDGSRLDLMLTADDQPDCYVEIKSSTLVENNHAFFPDAVTIRGKKHLNELLRLKKEGFRAVNFYLVQRMDAELFSPATHIDPNYSETLNRVSEQGVEILVYDAGIDLTGMYIRRRLPFRQH